MAPAQAWEQTGLRGRRSRSRFCAGSPAAPLPGSCAAFVPLLSRPWSRTCSCRILPRISGPISCFPDAALTLLVSPPRTGDFISATTSILPGPPEAARCHGDRVHNLAAALAGFPSQQLQWWCCGVAAASGAVSRAHAPPGWGEGRSERRGCTPARRAAAGIRTSLHPGVPQHRSLTGETRARHRGGGGWGAFQAG